MSPELKELDGVVPNVQLGPSLLPRWLQNAIDISWRDTRDNGTVYAAIVSDDALSIILLPTTFAVLVNRGNRIKLDIMKFFSHMSRKELCGVVKQLNERELDASISIKAEIVDTELWIEIHFQTVNITAVGVRRRRWSRSYAVLGNDPRVGISAFGGILDIPNLFAHAEREIFEEAGFRAKNLWIIGMIRVEKAVILVGVFHAPPKWMCRLRFPFRQDHDKEMKSLVFVPENKIREILHSRQMMWSPLPEVLEKAMS